jgi:hypothetical protein
MMPIMLVFKGWLQHTEVSVRHTDIKFVSEQDLYLKSRHNGTLLGLSWRATALPMMRKAAWEGLRIA